MNAPELTWLRDTLRGAHHRLCSRPSGVSDVRYLLQTKSG